MRLSERLRALIKSGIIHSFGDVEIYLFGSRTDDSLRGGDIDIAIKTDLPRTLFRRKKAEFFAYLIRRGYDLKIDLVPYNRDDPLLFEEISKNKILL